MAGERKRSASGTERGAGREREESSPGMGSSQSTASDVGSQEQMGTGASGRSRTQRRGGGSSGGSS